LKTFVFRVQPAFEDFHSLISLYEMSCIVKTNHRLSTGQAAVSRGVVNHKKAVNFYNIFSLHTRIAMAPKTSVLLTTLFLILGFTAVMADEEPLIFYGNEPELRNN